jgi:transaldolase
MTSNWSKLADLGQSVWYDNVARPALESGLLARIVRDDNVTGGTSNPSIFAHAVTTSDLYDAEISSASADATAQQIFEAAAVSDIRRACDLLRDVWERSGRRDGFISLEVEAALAYDADATVRRAHEVRAAVDRPNLMVKVPGTAPGVRAFAQLTQDGVAVNVTLLFSQVRYREVAEAYAAALERRLAQGLELASLNSVASFFVSRIDTKVDAALPEGSPLRGTIAVANAKLAYVDVYQTVFSGPRWQRLQEAGANRQRPLWASTSTKNPAYRATLYVDELIGPDTVNTVPDATLDAFRTGGRPARTIDVGVDEARTQIAALPGHGIDLDAVTDTLEREGVAAFADAYAAMIDAIAEKRARVAAG